LPVPVLDTVDQRRRDLLAAVDELRITGGHPQQSRSGRAQRVGQQRLQMIVDAKAVGIGHDLVHADSLSKTHGHQILGKHNAAAKRRQPDEFLLEVLRPPQRQTGSLLDDEGRIPVFWPPA